MALQESRLLGDRANRMIRSKSCWRIPAGPTEVSRAKAALKARLGLEKEPECLIEENRQLLHEDRVGDGLDLYSKMTRAQLITDGARGG